MKKAAADERLLRIDKKSQELFDAAPGANYPEDMKAIDFVNNIKNFVANVKWANSGRSSYESTLQAKHLRGKLAVANREPTHARVSAFLRPGRVAARGKRKNERWSA